MKHHFPATLAALFAMTLAAGCDNRTAGEQSTPPISEDAAPAAAGPSPQQSLEAQTTDFEVWTMIGEPDVQPESVAAPDGTMTADRLVLRSGEGLAKMIAGEGANVSIAVTLWSDREQSVALQLVDWCATDSAELETLPLVLSTEPTTYEMSITFARAEACPRFQIIKMDRPGEVFAWNARISRSS